MKNYIKPTIEILEQRIEKNTKDTGNSETESFYELAPIHTLRQKSNHAYDNSKLTGS